jgi:hypothetical protein
MSPSAFRQPGDVVNQIYSERIQAMIQVCLDAGDDPQALMDDVKRELQVSSDVKKELGLMGARVNHIENGQSNDG